MAASIRVLPFRYVRDTEMELEFSGGGGNRRIYMAFLRGPLPHPRLSYVIIARCNRSVAILVWHLLLYEGLAKPKCLSGLGMGVASHTKY